MKKLILFIASVFFVFMNPAVAFDKKRINYENRIKKLKKINPALARKVQSVEMQCFKAGKFDWRKNKSNIPFMLGGGLAKLHAFDMEKGVSYRRGLDKRRKKEENHPGRISMDIVTDMLKDEILHTDIKTYEVLMKVACSTSYLLGDFKLTGHVTTTAEHKIERSSGNCWDHAHVAVRVAKALGIPLERKAKGDHMFVAYKIPESKMHFAVDPSFCEGPTSCQYEFLAPEGWSLEDRKQGRNFVDKTMKSEQCYVDTMKNNPNKYLYFN